MSEKSPFEDFRADLDKVLAEVLAYFDRLIRHEQFALDLAKRLNGEVPVKMRDVVFNLRAMLEQRLTEHGEKIADAMTAPLRIRYYEDKIENKLASECPILEWILWHPDLTERTRTTSVVLTGTFSVASLLAVMRVAGLTSVKIPLYEEYPTASAVIFAALSMLSGLAAAHPEKIQLLMARERHRATEHLATYLHNAEADILDYADKAGKSLDEYFINLKGGGPTTV